MEASDRKRRGAWYTPEALVTSVVAASIDADLVARVGRRPVTVLDPACGDGRFLAAAAERLEAMGGRVQLTGFDIDADALTEAARVVPDAELVLADALGGEGPGSLGLHFDVVLGNPPYLSQLAAATARGAASAHGGGPYADAAVEFLALAADVVEPDGGRVAYVLPQSILASRDAQPVRARVDQRATMIWSAWAGRREFDADVLTCALAFEFRAARDGGRATPPEMLGRWAHVVTERVGVPALPSESLHVAGTLGDRAWLNANFRDEYYGMVGAVGDHPTGPPLVTSGVIDPGRSWWGERPIRFAKERYHAPRIDLGALDERMIRWARKRLVPKVLVANQTPILEAVADPDGSWLPGVPVVSVYPEAPTPEDAAASAWEIAAVLTSPFASAWAWHERGGTGMSADTIRVGPAMLAPLPWPAGDLGRAVAAIQAGDVVACGAAVDEAYGIAAADRSVLMEWWHPIVERIERRADAAVRRNGE